MRLTERLRLRSCPNCREAADEIERLQEHNLKLIDANVRLSDKVIHLQTELEAVADEKKN